MRLHSNSPPKGDLFMLKEQGENTEGTVAVPPAATEETITKIVSKRLSEDRAKLAKALGYDSWEAAMNSGMDKKLLDAGIEPETAKPIIETMVEKHTKVLEAEELIAREQKKRQEAELALLNTKYGININSLEALDAETKDLVSKGVSLDKAYAAIHAEEILASKTVATATKANSTSLNHMTSLPGGSATPPVNAISISQEEIKAVKQYLPNATEEDIKKFYAAHPELKK